MEIVKAAFLLTKVVIWLEISGIKWVECVPFRQEDRNNRGVGLEIHEDFVLSVCPWNNQSVTEVVSFIQESFKNVTVLYNETFYLNNEELVNNSTKEYEFWTYLFEGVEDNFTKAWVNGRQIENGSEVVFHRGRLGATLRLKDGNEFHVHSRDYCVQSITPDLVRVRTRPLNCSVGDSHSCVQKCCPIGHVVDVHSDKEQRLCVPSTHTEGTWWLPEFQDDNEQLPPISFYQKGFYELAKKCLESPHTNSFGQQVASQLDPTGSSFINFSVLVNGKVKAFPDKSVPYLIDYGKYCLDGIQGSNLNLSYSGLHSDHVVLYDCSEFDESSSEPQSTCVYAEKQINQVYLVFIPFATVFIILTIVVYALLWKTHNVHGKTLFGFLLGTLGFYVFLFLSRVGFFHGGDISCRIVAGGFHFFFLSYVCWLTAVNFDVWYTFRYLKAGKASHKSNRVWLYTLVAFGLPTVVVTIGVILDYMNLNYIVSPEYGTGRDYCSISTKEAIGLYLLLPMGILLMTNIAFFTWTIIILRQYQRSISSILKNASAKNEDNSYGDINTLKSLRENSLPLRTGCRQLGIAELVPRVGFGVFAKIFVLTGVTWIFDLVGWCTMTAVQGECGTLAAGLSWAFAVVDTFNILLAVAIFFLFVWKQPIYEELWHRYPCMQGFLKIFIVGKVFDYPKEKKMSITGMTMSTLRRDTQCSSRPSSRVFTSESRKVSTASTDSFNRNSLGGGDVKRGDGRKLSFEITRKTSTESKRTPANSRKTSTDSRKISTDSRKFSFESRKISNESFGEGVPAVSSPKRRKSSGGSSLFSSEGSDLSVVPEEVDGLEGTVDDNPCPSHTTLSV